MKRLWSRAQHYLSAEADLSLSERVRTTVRRGARYAKEAGAAAAFLRGCDRVGEGARVIGGRPRIDNQGYISIGARTVLTCEMGPTTLRTGPQGRLLIGESVLMNFGTQRNLATIAQPAPPRPEPSPEPTPDFVWDDVNLPEPPRTEEPVNIDWASVALGLLALIAVGGLIPFWMWVYFVYNPPVK